MRAPAFRHSAKARYGSTRATSLVFDLDELGHGVVLRIDDDDLVFRDEELVRLDLRHLLRDRIGHRLRLDVLRYRIADRRGRRGRRLALHILDELPDGVALLDREIELSLRRGRLLRRSLRRNLLRRSLREESRVEEEQR